MCEEEKEETFEQRFNRIARPTYQQDEDDGYVRQEVKLKINEKKVFVLRKEYTSSKLKYPEKYSEVFDDDSLAKLLDEMFMVYPWKLIERYTTLCQKPECIGHSFLHRQEARFYHVFCPISVKNENCFDQYLFNTAECEEHMMCPICYGDFDSSQIRLACVCAHYLCKTCYRDWFRTNQKDSCPCCRRREEWPQPS